MPTIFAISPVQKIRVPVGNIDRDWKTATFYISEKRLFQEGKSAGIDENIYRRKAVQYCEFVQFDLYSGEKYRISKEDFEKNSWVYPRQSAEKAPRSNFTPKRMIKIEKLEELAAKKPDKEEELKEMFKNKVFG
jgi:hypothetical protein